MRHSKSKVYTSGFAGRRAKGYQLKKGDGLWDNFKRFTKRSGKFLVDNGRVVANDVIRTLGPQVLTLLASKGAEEASKRGAPDFLVNHASKMVQKGAQDLSSSRNPELSKNQKMVSQFVSNNSQSLLDDILKRTGNGSRLLGNGPRLLGNGSRLLGNGDTFVQEAPRI